MTLKGLLNFIYIPLAPLIMPMLTMNGAELPHQRNVSDEDARKADYIYMEAQRQHVLGNEDAYFDLLKRAHQLNPKDTAIGFYLGYYGITIAKSDSAAFMNSYNLMCDHFNENPADYYNSYMVGNVANHLEDTDMSIRVWSTLDSIYPDKFDPAFKLADVISATGDSAGRAQAINIYNRIEKVQGKNMPLTTRKMRTYMATQDTSAVIGELHELLASSPNNCEYNVFAGDIFAMFEQGDSALHYYDRACEIDPSSGLAYYQRANYYKSAGDSIGYDREVFAALSQESLDLDTKIELMVGYIRALYDDPAQQPRISQLFSTMLEQNPHEVQLHDLYTSYLYTIDDFKGAAEQLEYAVDVDPSDESRWISLMTMDARNDDTPKAIDDGLRALHYHADSPSIMLLLGANYLQAKDYNNAEAYYKKALEATPAKDFAMQSSIYTSLGDLETARERRDSAYVFYDQALLLNPRNYLALNNYAYSLAVEGKDLDKAEKMSAITIREKPEDPTQLDTYAWVLFKKQDYVEAKAYIQKAMDLNDEPNEEILHHAGDIYFWNNDVDTAVELWKQALELDSDNDLLRRKVENKTYFFK